LALLRAGTKFIPSLEVRGFLWLFYKEALEAAIAASEQNQIEDRIEHLQSQHHPSDRPS
jgi:hypothetical protein